MQATNNETPEEARIIHSEQHSSNDETSSVSTGLLVTGFLENTPSHGIPRIFGATGECLRGISSQP